MEFTIDIKNKIVTIGKNVNIGDLVDVLKKWYPEKEWKKFQVKSDPFNLPYTIPIYVREWWNPYPIVTYGNGTGDKPIEFPSLPIGTYEVKMIGESTAQN